MAITCYLYDAMTATLLLVTR